MKSARQLFTKYNSGCQTTCDCLETDCLRRIMMVASQGNLATKSTCYYIDSHL